MISPCISICTNDPITGYCLGCFRTRREVVRWRHMTEKEQRAVLEQLKKRNPRRRKS